MITHVISWGIRMCQKNCAPPIFCSSLCHELQGNHRCSSMQYPAHHIFPMHFSACEDLPQMTIQNWGGTNSGDISHETPDFWWCWSWNTDIHRIQQRKTTLFDHGVLIHNTYVYICIYIYIGGHIHLVINFCLSGPLPRHAAPCALVKKTSRAEGLEKPLEMARYWWSIPTILIGQIYENHPIFPEPWGK